MKSSLSWEYDDIDHKNRIKRNLLIIVEWHDVAGNYHSDYFCNSETKYRIWGNGDNGQTHIWNDPEQGVRQFLYDLPIHDIKISVKE